MKGVDDKIYAEIEKMIEDEKNPVGIDVKDTHIYIINKLLQIEKRLEEIEKQKN